MKSHHTLSLLACLSTGVHSFPAFTNGHIPDAVASKLSGGLGAAFHEIHHKRLLFDPLTEPINVSGEHEFIAPDFEGGDQRGPCPGLNALANHGYIARNGVTTLIEVTAAMNTIYGMGIELASILAVMGTVFVGNPLSLSPGFSIGYESSASQNLLDNVFGLLGTPRGLNGSHNIIEGDSSMTRGDLYVSGDATTLHLDQFQALYDMVEGEGNYTYDIFGARAATRFAETIKTNPNFYYGPFTGMIARNAGYLFACRIFANHSTENPSGYLNKETLKSFFAIQGEEGNLTYNKGWERIPDNWYRMPVDYSLVQLNLDLVGWLVKYPQLASIGGNTGSVNSFSGVDPANLTGGVLNSVTLLENNNLLCFVFEILKTVTPNSLSTLFSIIQVPLKLVTDALGVAALSLVCPAFEDMTVGGTSFEDVIKERYPGALRSGNVL